MNAFEQITRCALGQQGIPPAHPDGHWDGMLGWVAIYVAPDRSDPCKCRFPILSLLRQP